MWRYVGKRVIEMIPILLAVAILIFLMMQLVPGDPIQIMLGDTATESQIEEARERLGLNEPLLIQMKDYLLGLLHLDFGTSYTYGTDVGTELINRYPNTLKLALFSCLLSLVGVPIGISCALHANKLEDRVWMFITMFLNSMPGFWLALMLVLLFSLRLGILPSSGIGNWKNYILPVIASALPSIAGVARQTRAAMLEVIRSDYVVTARSKGLSENAVIWKHAIPNAMIPIITCVGSNFGFLIGTSVVIETIFSIPGIGSYLLSAINGRDYPVVQGSIILLSVSFAALMLLVDLAYAYVDPRIKAQYASGPKQKTKANK